MTSYAQPSWADASARMGLGSVLWPGTTSAGAMPDDALVCESVTSVLKTLYAFPLEKWKLNNVAKTAYRRTETMRTMSEPEWVKFATRQDSWARDHELTDAECGTEVHKQLESVVMGAQARVVHPEAAPFIAQFDSWRAKVSPTYEAVECTVFDPNYLYAGTLDAIATLADGRRYLLDYKTTRNPDAKGPYPEWALQLAAYRFAPYVCPFRVWVPDQPFERRRYYINRADLQYALPTPAVDGAAIVHLYPDGWRMYPVRVDEDVRDAFLYVRGAQQFTEVIARRSVFGAYLEGAA